MAIKNISNQTNLPRIGKIHLGIKDSQKSYPKAVDYFVVKEEKTTPKEAADAFKKVYGEKPNKLDIIIPCENEEIFFPQWLKEYNSKQLVCRGDGEKAQRLQENGTYGPTLCKGTECERYKNKKCREIGNFKFMLPKVPGIGVWQIDTSSLNSMININSAIEFIRRQTGGKISGMPLTLSLQPKEIVYSGMKKTVYVLNLSSDVMLSEISLNIDTEHDDEFPDDIPNDTEEKEALVVDDEIEDYPIETDEDETDNDPLDDITDNIYEIIQIGKYKGRNAIKLKNNEKELTVLSKEEVNEVKGTKIKAEIEQQGKYNVLLNYQIA